MNLEFARTVLFYVLAALAVLGGIQVAFSRNIVHSAFALLATFAGVAGLYAILSADLVAVIQLMVYVGGVLILILFSVMLTSRIEKAEMSNPVVGPPFGIVILLAVAALLTYSGISVFGGRTAEAPGGATAPQIGNALLGPYVLPFEVISVLLLAVLLGAVTIAGGRLRRPETDPRGEGK